MKLPLVAIAAVVVAASAWPGTAGAQHQITGATGDVVQGGELQLDGFEFGIKDPVAPVLFDDFESGVSGDPICTGDAYTDDSCNTPWDQWYGYATAMAPQPDGIFTYSDAMTTDGRGRVAEVYHPVDGNLQYLIKNFIPTGKLYFNADHKMVFPDFISTQVKPMRFRTRSNMGRSIYAGRTMCDDDGNDSGGASGYGLDWVSSPDLLVCIEDQVGVNWTKPDGWLNWMDWITWEWILEEGTEGHADTYSKVVFNTEVKNETHTLCALEPGGGSYDQLIVGGQASTLTSATCIGPSAIGCYTYWDHVYFDTSFQRIELGNTPVYQACTKRVIQYPIGWSPTQVAVNVNLGTFGDTEDLYAFVVDESNQPSDGFLVRPGQDPGPPGAPGTPTLQP